MFFAKTPSGYALMQSDGTAAGTSVVREFGAEAEHQIWNSRQVGDKMFFTLDRSALERRVWVTDGTAKGTFPLKLGGRYIFLSNAADLNGVMYLSRTNKQGVDQLWRTDGTEKGTRRLMKFGKSRGAYLLHGADEFVFMAVDDIQ